MVADTTAFAVPSSFVRTAIRSGLARRRAAQEPTARHALHVLEGACVLVDVVAHGVRLVDLDAHVVLVDVRDGVGDGRPGVFDGCLRGGPEVHPVHLALNEPAVSDVAGGGQHSAGVEPDDGAGGERHRVAGGGSWDRREVVHSDDVEHVVPVLEVDGGEDVLGLDQRRDVGRPCSPDVLRYGFHLGDAPAACSVYPKPVLCVDDCHAVVAGVDQI